MKWVGVLALAACAKAPETPDFFNAGDLVIDDAGNGTVVSHPDFAFRFARPSLTMQKLAMPESITLGGNEVLGANDACNLEGRVGLALFPGLNITSHDGHLGPEGMVVESSIAQTPGMSGPGVAQFAVSYGAQVRLDRDSGDGTLLFSGSSLFTIFTNGRVVRTDTFVPFEGEQPLTGQFTAFGCAGATNNFIMTSYWAFEISGSQLVDGAGNGPVQDMSTAACTFYQAQQNMIAVAWPQATPVRTRFGVNDLSIHVFDLIDRGSTSVASGERSVTSRVQLATGIGAETGCGDLLARLDTPPLSINGVDFTQDIDGIYRDDSPHEGDTVAVTTGEFAFPAGFTISLDIGASRHLRIDGPRPTIQLANNVALFVFSEAIDRDTTITIELF